MSEDSLGEHQKTERHRRRRKRASRNLEEVNHDNNVNEPRAVPSTERVPLQDVAYRGTASGQGRSPSSGNSNSLELSDERKSKPRRTRKRASAINSRQNVGKDFSYSLIQWFIIYTERKVVQSFAYLIQPLWSDREPLHFHVLCQNVFDQLANAKLQTVKHNFFSHSSWWLASRCNFCNNNNILVP